MAAKPDKEKKSPGKTGSASAREPAKKISPKPKKQPEEDDEDDSDDEMETALVSKKTGKPVASSKSKKDDDDDDDSDVDDGPDDWEKPEEEEEWDPDFEEFDVPKSKVKKTSTGGKKAGDEDFAFDDDEFKDLLNDKDYDDDEEDDF